MTPPARDLPAGKARAAVRAAVADAVLAEDARLGLLFDRSGIVSATAGEPGELDPVTFASLASAQTLAALDLAPLVGGAEFTHLLQVGRRASMALVSLADGGVLALLHETERTKGALRPGRVPDVSGLNAAVRALAVEERAAGAGSGDLDQSWVRAAEGEIDRIFGGEA